MRCLVCGHEQSKVVDSRITDGGTATRRRRECESCSFRFTTFERMQTTNLVVQKSNGASEPYDRDKLMRSLLIACGKREVPVDRIREKIYELEEKWSRTGVVTSQQVGEDLLRMLRTIDEVAYIRFASVYRQFGDIQSFKKVLEKEF